MKNLDKQTKRLLLIGFGGLILLLAVSGLAGLSVLRQIQTENESIREDYVNRDRILEHLRSDIYLSGTYVRDLLLEQEPGRADMHRVELEAARARIYRNVDAYDHLLRPEELQAFGTFKEQLDRYFKSLQPALEWNAAQRRLLGYAFMKSSLLPRRMEVVRLADQVSGVNQSQMETGNKQVANLFYRFRRSLIVVIALSLISGVFLAAGSILRILRLEKISAKRFEETENAREALRELSARLIEVQESERRSLARELHDEVGQSVSALLLGIGNVAAVMPPDIDEKPLSQLMDLRRLAEKTVAVVRDMSLLLRPSMLDDLGLIPALQWQAREVSRSNNVYVQVVADSIPDDLTDEQKTCIYRLVQEALRNTVRHAKAKNVRITLNVNEDNLSLTIRDDGQGFNPEREKGLGLLGMEERVAHLGGSFQVESQFGAGTTIRVELPIHFPSRDREGVMLRAES